MSDDITRLTWWKSDHISFGQKGYKLRDGATVYDLPIFLGGTLPSGETDMYKKCGSLTYTITTPDSNVFIQASGTKIVNDDSTAPTVKVWSWDIWKVNHTPPFERFYKVGMYAYFNNFPELSKVDYPSVENSQLNFRLNDPCFEASYDKVQWLSTQDG